MASALTARVTCQKCADLAKHLLDLRAQLAKATDRLAELAGMGEATKFATALVTARETRWRCNQANEELQEHHRAEHRS